MSTRPPQGNAKTPFRSPPKDLGVAIRNAEALLEMAEHIPLLYWRPAMLFTGAADRGLYRLTKGRFPAGPLTSKRRPVFALKPLSGACGFKVCPCSTKIPFDQAGPRYIRQGCRLRPTGRRVERDSFLVENMTFNIPPSMALSLRFLGVVPDECLRREGRAGEEGRML
ncbi:MAG: hypothetical protein ACOWYE_00080 [Desulfatiglandales bacterium]